MNKTNFVAPKDESRLILKRSKTLRNPAWSRDELILTLDFYQRYSPHFPGKSSAEIAELSEFLNRLQAKLGGDRYAKFRNTNGVYMKLMNFRRFDPTYLGTGLSRGNKDEEAVWDLYASQPAELAKVADSIRKFAESEAYLPPAEIVPDDEAESQEGALLTRTHRYRERDSSLVRRKKESFYKMHGALFCEVCDFDFAQRYGDHGHGFIECHHTQPLSELKPGQKTKLSDLILICANCHRMAHCKRPWLEVDELRMLLNR